MTILIALLKGINVGNNNRIKMADLRQLVINLGYSSPKTVLASGNVVFSIDDPSPDLDAICTQISNAVQTLYDYRIEVICLTASDWQTLIDNNPFANRDDVAGNKLVAICLQTAPPPDAVTSLVVNHVEEIVLIGNVLYIHYINGQARTKLTLNTIEKALDTIGTGRNWNTIEKIQMIISSFSD